MSETEIQPEPVTEAAPPPAPAPVAVPTFPHALFAVGSLHFGLPIASVGEVVSEMSVTRLPHASRGLLGVVNLRGEILPATSLQPWFGDAAKPGTTNLFLVVRAASNAIAVRIDRFEQVAPVPQNALHPDEDSSGRAEVAPQVWRRPEGEVHCLSAEALFEALKMKKTQPAENPVA
jgi:chemotaxis signal transduction protein